MNTTIFFGDSLTSGRYGIGYARYLPIPKELHGIEGDNSGGIMARAIAYVKKSLLFNKTIVLQGGANDILIPYASKIDPTWEDLSKTLGTNSQRPLQDCNRFIERFSSQLESLTEIIDARKVMICSIPCIGEDLQSELNDIRRTFNEAMQTVVERTNASWCDITSVLDHYILEKSNVHGRSTYLLGSTHTLQDDASFVSGDEQKSRILSTSRKLYVTVDGIHPNDIGAKLIAQAILSNLQW